MTETREIPLTQGKVAIVDAADYEWLSQWKWYAMMAGEGYAARSVRLPDGRKGIALMHRVILEPRSDQDVDHIDGNGFNNSRSNLRACTHGENLHNQRKARINTSGFKGVFYDRRVGKWQAQIKVNNKNRSFGLHNTPEDAARAYDKAARELHGDFARLNFPD